MASAYGNAAGSYGRWQVYVTADITKTTDTACTVRVRTYWHSRAWGFDVYGSQGSATCDGTSSGTKTFHAYSANGATVNVLVAEVTKTISRSYTADKTIKCSGTATLSGGYQNGTSSATVNVTIPQALGASEPTVTGDTIGSAITIKTNRKSSSFTHEVSWAWAGHTGTIAIDVGAQVTWTPAVATFAPWLTDASQADCTITCETFSGSQSIGTKSVKFKLKLPSSVGPIITSNSFSGTNGIRQTVSEITAHINAQGQYGATITRWYAKLGSAYATSTTSGDVPLGTVADSGVQTYTLTVTDSRGMQATVSDVQMVAKYVPPALEATAYRGQGTEDDESSYVTVTASCDVYVNSDSNTGTLRIRTRVVGTGQWTLKSTTSQGGGSTTRTVQLSGMLSSQRYEVQVELTDKYGTVASTIIRIDTASPVMDFRSDGEAMAFFGVSTRDGVDFNREVYARKGLTIPYGDDAGLSLEDQYEALVKLLEAKANGRGRLVNHLALANDVAITGESATGAETALLRVNASGEVELGWTTGGLKGRVWKEIWSGNASSGTISVPELPYYNIFGVGIGATDSTAVCSRDVDNPYVLRGIGGMPYVSNAGLPAMQFYAFDMDVAPNGTTLTLTRVYQHTLYFDGSEVSTLPSVNLAKPIYKIYGIL